MSQSNYEWSYPELSAASGRLQLLYDYMDTVVKSRYHVAFASRIKPLIKTTVVIARDPLGDLLGSPQLRIANLLVTAFSGLPFEVYINREFFGNVARAMPDFAPTQSIQLPEITNILPVPEILPANIRSLFRLGATLMAFQHTFERAGEETSKVGRIKTAAYVISDIFVAAIGLIPVLDDAYKMSQRKALLASTVTRALADLYGIELFAV